jgi:hypothetical protein
MGWAFAKFYALAYSGFFFAMTELKKRIASERWRDWRRAAILGNWYFVS